MSELSDELTQLTDLKAKWLKKYQGFAYQLCLAILVVGVDDDMDDPVSKRRHHMTIKCRMAENIKIIATEMSGSFIKSKNDYSCTRRLIVTVDALRPVYITFSDDLQEIENKKYDVFVPGEWQNFAQQILTIYDNLVNDQTIKDLTKKLDELKKELLVDMDEFGEKYIKEVSS